MLLIVTDNVHHFCPGCLKTLCQLSWCTASMLWVVCDWPSFLLAGYIATSELPFAYRIISFKSWIHIQAIVSHWLLFSLIFHYEYMSTFFKGGLVWRYLFTLKIKVSVVLQIILIIKLRVNKTKWTGLLVFFSLWIKESSFIILFQVLKYCITM